MLSAPVIDGAMVAAAYDLLVENPDCTIPWRWWHAAQPDVPTERDDRWVVVRVWMANRLQEFVATRPCKASPPLSEETRAVILFASLPDSDPQPDAVPQR